MTFLPYGRHVVEDDDVAAVAEVLRGDWLTTGPAVATFERAFAARVGARHAVACANGTAALHLAALSLNLGPGDRVAVPTLTFLATANAARFVGADVAFCDVDPDTALMTAAHLASTLDGPHGSAIRAVFPVHFAGQCVDMPALAAVARARGLAIVEDGCHALGASQGGSAVGACAFSDMTVFSLHPVKTVTAGEGGVVTTNDGGLAERLRRLRGHGIVRDGFEVLDQAYGADGTANPWYYEMAELGFNYRLSDINCALATTQLARLDRFVARRAELVARYDAALAGLAPLVRPLARSAGRPSWHLYVALVDFATAGISRARVMQALKAQGIGSQVHYLPVHRQPYYRRRYGLLGLPGADSYYARCLSLPLFPAMADADVDRVVEALKEGLQA